MNLVPKHNKVIKFFYFKVDTDLPFETDASISFETMIEVSLVLKFQATRFPF